MKFPIKDLFSKCDQIRRKLLIWSRLMKKTVIENFNFWAGLALLLMRPSISSNTFNVYCGIPRGVIELFVKAVED